MIVDRLVEISCAASDIVMGGDSFSDCKKSSIVSVLVYTPDAMYIHTGLWSEQRHTADNRFKFFAKNIAKMDDRNVFGFVTDTELKMQSVWAKLQEAFPWLVVVLCAAHVFDLLFKDVNKFAGVSPTATSCTGRSQFFRNRRLTEAILERILLQEYQAVRQLQRTGATRWKSELLVSDALLKTQTAMQKAVVDGVFKSEILKDEDPRLRQAAAELSDLLKNDVLLRSLETYVALMSPVPKVLDAGQGDLPGVGVVYASFTRLLKHFSTFPFPGDEAG